MQNTTPPGVSEVRLYSTRDIAALLRIQPTTVRRWVEEGRIKGFKHPGGHWRFFESEVTRIINWHARKDV